MVEKRPFAVVTGASSGIGRAFAKALAQEGFDQLLVARRKALLDELAAELGKTGVRAHVLAEDLTSEGAPSRVLARSRDLGPCGLLVNNAGVGMIGKFASSDWERMRSMFQLNVVATTELMHLFVKDMLGRGSGTVMNVASTAGFQPVPHFAPYAATKAYLLSLTEAVADEIRGSGVRVVALCPGATETEFNDIAGVDGKQFEAAYMTPEKVARIGVKGALSGGRTVVIPGAVNWATAVGSKILPRAALARMAGWIYRRVDPNEGKRD
jgi:uncharacterized protein